MSTEGLENKGIIAWMVHNKVTPNLMMLIFLLGGAFCLIRIKQEVYPEFELDTVTVTVPYPGSSPEEVEQGIILAVEEAIRGLEGIKEVSAVAAEGRGTVTAELLEGADQQKVYQDIKQEIDRITTFPQDAEEPEVNLVMRRRQVVTMQIYGDVSEWVLRELAEQVRDSLLTQPGITQVELEGAREYEVQILVDQDTLRTYGLTLESIADKIRRTSVELPGGHIETRGGEVLLRVMERRDWAHEFAAIPIVTTPDGSILTLADIGEVRDDFEDVDAWATFNGKRAIGVAVYRIGDQTPIGVSDATKRAMAQIESQLPPGVDWSITYDAADTYRQRLELLVKNAFQGLILVFALLALFLEFKLAIWVTMGIPISFLGAFLFMPQLDVTINMMSMFAFIIALGMVVDSGVVVGENIYEYRSRGMGQINAAIAGARDMVVPVAFSMLTNIIGFLPLAFVPGVIGKTWKVIPLVVITVFMIAWVEAMFILPTQLAHVQQKRASGLARYLHERQQAFSRLYQRFIDRLFAPFLDLCIRYRQLTVALGAAIVIVVMSYVASGRIGMILMPRVEADYAAVTATLPFGSPAEKVEEVSARLVRGAEAVIAENGGDRLSKGVFARINEDTVDVRLYLTDPDVRPISTARVAELWREKVGPIPGLESLRFESDRGGPGSGAALTVELSHRDIDVLDRASAALAEMLEDFSNVKDINDGYTPGKQQLNFRIKPEGLSLGLTAQDIARQVRSAFYGAEAVRQQRGRNEVRARVKLPQARRQSEYDIEQLLIRAPSGKDVPLRDVAERQRGRSYTSINRRNGRRTVTVTADVEPIDETGQVMATLKEQMLPQLQRDFPGLSYGWEGRQADMRESMANLRGGLMIALVAIFASLVIPFRNYIQPVIIMIAIPLGLVGAVLGHMAMGYSLSIMSMMGIVALSGVVVNNSLVLLDYANVLRAKDPNLSAHAAILAAGIRRFRPIMLTTLTTFGGLAPMIFETSRQAKFMIPMALSLGYGILFATAVTLIIVPCLYMLLEDATRALQTLRTCLATQTPAPTPASDR
jgi:multidrug efflux pump subunit AcrB